MIAGGVVMAFVAGERRRQPVLWLGDNLSDFSKDFSSSVPWATRLANAQVERAAWGKKWIAFPNPVYGGFLLSLPKLDKPDGTQMTVGDDLRSGEQTEEQVREALTPEQTPKLGVLDIWEDDPDAEP